MTQAVYRVLITDPLPEEALAVLESAGGIEVLVRPGLKGEELLRAVAEADGLIVRSGTRVTAEVLGAGGRLKAVARAGVGVDNIDLAAATRRGVVVMNTPGGNAVSTAELALALLLAAARHIPQAHASVCRGEWNRKAFTGTQLAGKTLGVVGLGRVGREVARRAHALGMNLLAYDPYVSATVFEQLDVRRCDGLAELLRSADAVTIHVPLTSETRGLIGAAELALMKPEAILVNCARGGIVDEAALAEALNSGRLAAAAVDVFENEPPRGNPLLRARNVVLTPHLGASTAEAQVQVAVDAAKQMADALLHDRFRNALNVPELDKKTRTQLDPYLDLALRLGALAVQLFEAPLSRVELTYVGELTRLDVRPITASFLVGMLRPVLEERVNRVNAPVLAAERGVVVEEVKSTAQSDYVNLVGARVESADGQHYLAGTIYGRNDPRLVNLDGCRLEARPAGQMLFISNLDRPGVIGTIGTVCARHGINIADMTVGRLTPGGRAVTVLNLDSPPSEAAIEQMAQDGNIQSIRRIALPAPASSSSQRRSVDEEEVER